MKIAVVSDDGTSISRHFGRATMYVVLTVENGLIIKREKRLRTSLGRGDCHNGSLLDCQALSQNHESSGHALIKHHHMTEAIADCEVIIAGGMGYGAYASLKSRHMETVITDQESIDKAISLFLDGNLLDLKEKLH